MSHTHLSLQHSESIVVAAASHIYSAYIGQGQVEEGKESHYIEKAVREAIYMAQLADSMVISDGEIEH